MKDALELAEDVFTTRLAEAQGAAEGLLAASDLPEESHVATLEAVRHASWALEVRLRGLDIAAGKLSRFPEYRGPS
jgi:hypothetical protein